MRPTFVHCLFEQSGVFKHAFRQLGIYAVDYDIRDDFDETNIRLDLFKQISDAYYKRESIFDNILSEELIIAFFPCIYFNESNEMYFCGTNYYYRGLDKTEILERIIERSQLREEYYRLLLMLFHVCESRHLKLIVENPYNAHHYLRFNFPYKPAVIDMNRQLRGDYFKKPTQYFFLNLSPGKGCSIQYDKKRRYINNQRSSDKSGMCSVERSMISPDYAHNFICDFILDEPSGNNVPTLFD